MADDRSKKKGPFANTDEFYTALGRFFAALEPDSTRHRLRDVEGTGDRDRRTSSRTQRT